MPGMNMNEILERQNAELKEKLKKQEAAVDFIRGVVKVAATLAVLLMLYAWFGRPYYRVWQQGKLGEAELRRATQNRQIQVEQARAEEEAAQLRAHAISIVGQAAKDFPEYRYQEFLGGFSEALKEGTIQQIIYVPTEAGIPLLEAGRGR